MRRRNKIALLIFFPLGSVFLAQSQVQSGAPNQSPPAAAAGTQSSTAPLAPSGVQSVSQNPEDSSESGVYVFRKQVEEVVLHATVIDDKQRIITSLDKGDFTVYEDNHPQTITSFRREDIPVAMCIVVDNSGSMREKRQKVNAAALNLVRSSNPEDQVCVVNFNDEY
ncbi:MAG TPA: VWA domain-containing protein, partial [Terriglobales bacterium]|nr:VWA domain-containing protein [Terriglobales bacterium]